MVAEIRVYFEGNKKLRQGFHSFFQEFARPGLRLNLVHGGSDSETVKDFMDAVRTHPDAFNIILIDSDEPDDGNLVPNLRKRKEWDSRAGQGVSDRQIHFMVQVMESWFLADKEALATYYGQGFQQNSLPPNPRVEQIPKSDVIEGLKNATRGAPKGNYHKSRHAPEILDRIDAAKVRRAAPSCDRLLRVFEEANHSVPGA